MIRLSTTTYCGRLFLKYKRRNITCRRQEIFSHRWSRLCRKECRSSQPPVLNFMLFVHILESNKKSSQRLDADASGYCQLSDIRPVPTIHVPKSPSSRPSVGFLPPLTRPSEVRGSFSSSSSSVSFCGHTPRGSGGAGSCEPSEIPVGDRPFVGGFRKSASRLGTDPCWSVGLLDSLVVGS
jgi:hypothetical protein